MADATRQLEEDIGKVASERVARNYAHPRHREEPTLPVATSPWQGDALSFVQTTILRMTYGEMMDFSKGLVASLHHQDKEIDEGVMAKALHHWAMNYSQETEK